MANFFYYGCKKLVVSVLDEDNDTYGTPWEEKYPKQVGISNSSNSSQKFYGGDRIAYQANGTGGRSLDIQTTALSDAWYTDVLGQTKVNGVIMEGPDDSPAAVAIGVELSGDGGGMKMWFLYCKVQNPTFTPSTNTDSITEVSMSSAAEASPVEIISITEDDTTTVYEKTVLVCRKGESEYDTFLDAVPTTYTVAP